MSAATIAVPAAPAAGADARPGLIRLASVELRKMVDTRAGFWLVLSAIGFALVATVIGAATAPDAAEVANLKEFAGNAALPFSLLGPVVAILLITSEWSQRTALVTFSIVPQRMRVITAKILAVIVITVIFTAIAIALGAAATVISGVGENKFDYSLTVAVQTLLRLLLGSMLCGFAFGLVFLMPAPAIALYFILPTFVSIVGNMEQFDRIAGWVDPSRTMGNMYSAPLTGDEWVRVAVSVMIWTGIPFIIGLWRVRRADVK